MNEIGIVEAKNIIKSMNEKYGIDYSDYALTSFKQRIERIMEMYGIKFVDLLLNKIYNDPDFIDTFVHEISVPSTEMFRDPSLWRLLREDIIPGLARENSSFKIWIPGSVSGDELYSVAVILTEMGLLDKVQIIVSSVSDKSLKLIQSGLLQPSKFDISCDNYIRSNGKELFDRYLLYKDNTHTRDKNLIKNTTFIKQDVSCEAITTGVKLVLFRNKMIYFNQVLQYKTIKNIYQAMSPGGYFVIGIQETLNQFYGLSEFAVFNENESIYKRK